MRVYMKRNADNVINRRPFKEATIEGYYYGKVYVINSYRTPIAVYNPENNLWYLSTEKHSQITSRQQSALRLILSEEVTLPVEESWPALIQNIQAQGIGK